MNWERISNCIGIGLVLLCFVFSLGRIFTLKMREKPGAKDSVTTLRIAHFSLEAGVREALDEIGRQYMEQHPNVRVLQIPIPEKVFKNWRITQLVGKNPPDLLVTGYGLSEEHLARYFIPITDIANKPNPYNQGTPLENTPLRETFFDGMESGFNQVLLDYYGVPATTGTMRMFYNVNLLREITGDTKVPANYREFLELCQKTRAFSQKTGRRIVPVGSSLSNANILMDYIFNSQTQRLLQEKINRPGLLSPRANAPKVISSYFLDEWNLDSPEIVSGLTLVRNVITQLPPGFAQMSRDDGSTFFAQGNSVMTANGSWDAISLQKLSPFPIITGKLPLPDKSDPEFGRFAYGVVSEAGNDASFCLAVPKDGNPELAIDFLLFMSSMKMNKVWTDVSGWPPAVVGVPPSAGAESLMPEPGGYPAGFPINNLGSDTMLLYSRNLYLLTSPQGSVKQFLDALKPEYDSVLKSDMERALRNNRGNVRRTDSTIAYYGLHWKEDPAAMARLDLLLQARAATEKTTHQNIEALHLIP